MLQEADVIESAPSDAATIQVLWTMKPANGAADQRGQLLDCQGIAAIPRYF
jgi:hypothetical protein